MGELHLEIIVDRMKREFGVDANVGAPQSPTASDEESVEQEGKFIPPGADATIRSREAEARSAASRHWHEFVDADQGRRVPKSSYLRKKASRRRCRTACSRFPRGGFKVTLTRYHE